MPSTGATATNVDGDSDSFTAIPIRLTGHWNPASNVSFWFSHGLDIVIASPETPTVLVLFDSGNIDEKGNRRHIVELQRSSVSDEEAKILDAASAAGAAIDTQVVAGALGADSLDVEDVMDRLAQRGQFLRRAGTAKPDRQA